MFLFVYGYLKRNQKHHRTLKKAVFIDVVETVPNYLLYDWTNAYLVKVENGRNIEGELFDVPQDIIDRMDRMSALMRYERKRILLTTHKDKEVYSYIFQGNVSQFLDCGTSWPRT